MREKTRSITLLRKTIYLVLAIILIVATQNAFALPLQKKITLQNFGLISYSQYRGQARPLHVEGNQIKNDLGEVVYLRGWNKGRGAETKAITWGQWEKYQQSKVDLILDKMKSYGANVVRQFITLWCWKTNYAMETDSGIMTTKQVLHDLLTRAASHGMYVIIAFYSKYPKNCPIHGFHNDSWVDSAGWDPYTTNGHTGLVMNSTEFVNLVVDLVDELGSHENLIIEPYNEVFCGYTGDYYLNLWQSVWQNIINGVRQKEAEKGYVNHLIIVQFGANTVTWGLNDNWNNFNWYWSHPLADPANNLVYSQHLYRSWGSVGDQTPKENRPYDYATIKNIYDEQKIDDLSALAPLLIGEIGANKFVDSNNGEYYWLNNTLSILNEWGIHYVGFAWWDAGTPYDMLEYQTEPNTGGTVNKYGQLLVNAIKRGSG